MTVKREAELRTAFSAELARRLPRFLSLRLLDAGAPDRVVCGGGSATFLEFKHGTPDFDSPGNQELCCMRLDVIVRCRYVIWQETADGSAMRTLIVRPKVVRFRRGWDLEAEESFAGFAHDRVVEWIGRVHDVRLR